MPRKTACTHSAASYSSIATAGMAAAPGSREGTSVVGKYVKDTCGGKRVSVSVGFRWGARAHVRVSDDTQTSLPI